MPNEVASSTYKFMHDFSPMELPLDLKKIHRIQLDDILKAVRKVWPILHPNTYANSCKTWDLKEGKCYWEDLSITRKGRSWVSLCLRFGFFSFPLGLSQGVALSSYTFPSCNGIDFNLQPKVKLNFFGHLYLNQGLLGVHPKMDIKHDSCVGGTRSKH